MLSSLARRPRSRGFVERSLGWEPVAQLVRERVAREHEVTARREGHRRAQLDLAALRVVHPARDHRHVTDALAGRLAAGDLERVLAGLSTPQCDAWDAASEADQRFLALAYAMHQEDEQVIARTGLRPHKPPEKVHVMARGDISAAGALRMADLVVGEFGRSGLQLQPGQRYLDFGGSSGRVLHGLAAVYPEIDWMGCDPNQEAIAWASEHLAGSFFVSDQTPPLPLEDGTLDGAFAISIWSHFSAPAACLWLDEMHRVLKPGGRLLLTTHGWRTLALCQQWFEAGTGGLSPEHVVECQRSLLKTGTWFFDSFGEGGDWGVKSPDWGHSFFLPGWILDATLPRWALRSYVEAGLEGDQDLYVLERI